MIVHVTDENDNSPKFKGNGRPLVAVIPNTVPYGYPVIKIQVSRRFVLTCFMSIANPGPYLYFKIFQGPPSPQRGASRQ